MTKYKPQFLPNGIYLDTNILRKARFDLSESWMIELRAFANDFGIKLFLPELVLDEWTKYIFESLKSNYSKLSSVIKFFRDYNIGIPDFDETDVKLPEWKTLKDIMRDRLNNSGFIIIENWTGPLESLINEAVRKIPPFDEGGKGFCDVIILESIIKHASNKLKNARIMVISDDKAVKRSNDRFMKHDINVIFADQEDVLTILDSSLDKEAAALQQHREELLFNFVKTYEALIIDFIKKEPIKFTDSWLDGYGDNKVEGSVTSVLSVIPLRITKVVGGVSLSQEDVTPDRYPINIWVEAELDVLVDKFDFFSNRNEPLAIEIPEKIDANAPLKINKRFNFDTHVVKDRIKRNIYVEATISKDKTESGDYKDFRLEKVN
jgi:hypothetical protein